jgi:hypothetical protein
MSGPKSLEELPKRRRVLLRSAGISPPTSIPEPREPPGTGLDANLSRRRG